MLQIPNPWKKTLGSFFYTGINFLQNLPNKKNFFFSFMFAQKILKAQFFMAAFSFSTGDLYEF